MNKIDRDPEKKGMFLALAIGAAAFFLTLALVLAVVPIPGLFPRGSQAGSSSNASTEKPSADNPPGAVLVEVPWKHLPHIDRFEMKNQEGEKFDSANLAGKPYAVSFFFATCPSICRDLNLSLIHI